MKPFLHLSLVILATIVVIPGCDHASRQVKNDILKGPYAGCALPGDTPQLFSPGFICTGLYERDVAVSPDGSELYFSVFLGDWVTIMFTKKEEGGWTRPEAAPFARDTMVNYCEPAFTPDGQNLMFLCTRPLDGSDPKPGWQDQNIWMVGRDGNGQWGLPEPLPVPVNDGEQFFPSLAKDGTLYFSRMDSLTKLTAIYKTSWPMTGKEPEKLPSPVNGPGNTYNACISPDGKCLVACITGKDTLDPGRPVYVAFFKEAEAWTGGHDLSSLLQMDGSNAISPSFSPDGKYFFFATSKRRGETSFSAGNMDMEFFQKRRELPGNGNADIYWVDSRVIYGLNINS